MASEMKTKITLLLALLLLFCGSLSADKLNDAYQKMLLSYGKLTSWQAVLSQTNYFKQPNTTLQSSGNFYYQKGKIAIRYSKPQIQILLVQNGTVTMYDKSANTALKSRLTSSVQSLDPVGIIRTYWGKSTKTLLKSKTGYTAMSLKPKNAAQIKEIRFTLANATGYVNQLTYFDPQGNSVTVAFSKMQVNKQIPASVWKLNLPSNARVMEQ
jgi:outer membrane lipoprotein-sorting protein